MIPPSNPFCLVLAEMISYLDTYFPCSGTAYSWRSSCLILAHWDIHYSIGRFSLRLLRGAVTSADCVKDESRTEEAKWGKIEASEALIPRTGLSLVNCMFCHQIRVQSEVSWREKGFILAAKFEVHLAVKFGGHSHIWPQEPQGKFFISLFWHSILEHLWSGLVECLLVSKSV